MPIQVGSSLPDGTFKIMTPEGPSDISVSEIFDNKKVVLIAVPGAFTPTCHSNHLPGYIENYDKILAKGVDSIAVISTNDVFVMNIWEKETGGAGKIQYLADGTIQFTKSIGMDIDLSAAGLGVRSQRYSMLVENREVKILNIEDSPGKAVATGASTLLDQL